MAMQTKFAEDALKTLVRWPAEAGPISIAVALLEAGWHPTEEPGEWRHPSRPGVYRGWAELAASAITQWDSETD